MPTIDEKNVKKLSRLFAAMDEDSLTRAEFIKAFEAVMKFVTNLKKTNEQEFMLMHSALSMLSDKVSKEATTEMSNSKKGMMDYCMKEMAKMQKEMDKMSKEQMDGMKFIYDKSSNLKADEPKIVQEVLAQIKLPEQKDVILDTGDQIIEKINSASKFIDKSAIKGFDELEKNLTQIASRRIQTPAKAYMVHVKDCTSQCDGSNKAFYIGGTHRGIIGVYSSQAPFHFRPIIDYTETATGFTMAAATDAIQTGQTLVAQFLK